MHTILIAVTGMSPQVVTETLYAIEQAGQPWPDELCLLTTAIGAEKAYRGLIEHDHLAGVARRLERPPYAKTAIDIRVIPDATGAPVDDVRTVADQEALGNFVMQCVRDFTEDPATRIHASIAGGRKTMTFYLGYAMSLFGRPQDRLSHVLVSDGYEQHPNFYYPTRESSRIETRDGRWLDTAAAHVELADIPFVRQRDELPAFLKAAGTELDLRQVIDQVNLAQTRDSIRLRLDDAGQRLDIGNSERWLTHITFENAQYWAWFRLVAIATRDHDPTLIRSHGQRLADRMIATLAGLIDAPAPEHASDHHAIRHWIETNENALEQNGFKPDNLHQTLGGAHGFDPSIFCTRIRANFNKRVPHSLTTILVPSVLFEPDGTHRGASGHDHDPPKKKHGGYALNVPAEAISFISPK